MAVLVELKARFDEGANIEWAKRAGEGRRPRRLRPRRAQDAHEDGAGRARRGRRASAATATSAPGNYNSRTARTLRGRRVCSPPIRSSAPTSPSCSTTSPGYGRDVRYSKLLVAPDSAAIRLSRLDPARDQQAGGCAGGASSLKMNSLVDADMIDALYEASQAGVRDRPHRARHLLPASPGCPGCPRRIRVRSIIGRYLEHSRIYRFANGAGRGPPVATSSARPT